MAQIILDSNSNLIQGDFDSATVNNRTKLQTSTTNATTGERPTPADGMIRYNVTTSGFEGYAGGEWGSIGGGATGGGGDQVFYENELTVTTSYTLTTNRNAMSTGPITIDSGATVTIPSGQRWVIL